MTTAMGPKFTKANNSNVYEVDDETPDSNLSGSQRPERSTWDRAAMTNGVFLTGGHCYTSPEPHTHPGSPAPQGSMASTTATCRARAGQHLEAVMLN